MKNGYRGRERDQVGRRLSSFVGFAVVKRRRIEGMGSGLSEGFRRVRRRFCGVCSCLDRALKIFLLLTPVSDGTRQKLYKIRMNAPQNIGHEGLLYRPYSWSRRAIRAKRFGLPPTKVQFSSITKIVHHTFSSSPFSLARL